MDAPPKTVIVCNYREATKVAARGAKAYVSLTNVGNGFDRIYVVVRSRGGRWIRKWEAMYRLGNFRIKSLPPENPQYELEFIEHEHDAAATLSDLIIAQAIHTARHHKTQNKVAHE